MSPFVVFSLPRSRSAWLSVFLSAPSAPSAICGHDIGPTLDRPEAFAERLQGDLAGACETGAAFAWRLIRDALPDAAFVVIRRPVADVLGSLERFGLTGLRDEMALRAGQLAEISRQPGTLTVDFEALETEAACARVYSHCLGQPMPAAWWAHLDPINIQVDMRRQLDLLTRRAPQIAALKAAIRERAAHA